MTGRRLSYALTSLAAHTFPPSRSDDARVVRDCARDAIDSAGMRALARESVSVAAAGLRVRLGVARADVLRAPWRAALATALVFAAVAWPVAWVMHGYAVWPHIVVPLGVAAALTLRAARAAAIESPPHDLRQGRRPREARR